MRFDLTKEDQHLFQELMAARGLDSPEALFRVLMQRMKSEESQRSREVVADPKSWEEFEQELDLKQVALRQRLVPVRSASELAFGDWPAEYSVDDFIAAALGQESSTSDRASP